METLLLILCIVHQVSLVLILKSAVVSHYKGNKIMLSMRENLEKRCFYNMSNNFIKESIEYYMKYLSFTLEKNTRSIY